MGESRRKALAVRRAAGDQPAELQVVDTLGGRMNASSLSWPHSLQRNLRKPWVRMPHS